MKRSKKINYGGGSITPTAYGTFSAYLRRGGRTLRTSHKTIEEAKGWIDANSTRAPITLSASDIQDAAEARAILPDDVSLLACAKAYIQGLERMNAEQPIQPLIDIYLDYQSSRIRRDTWLSYRMHLARFVSAIGPSVALFTADAIRRATSTRTAQSSNHMIRTLRAFFNWAIEHGHLSANPCANIKLERIQEPKRVILTLEQTEALLHAVHQKRPHLLGYFCLCLFGGLRPTEARRIQEAHIGDEYITLDASVTKTHSARTVPVEQGLREVLAIYPLGNRAHKSIMRMIAECGIPWTQDIMRHSYASYAYERSRDASATAYAMGHKGTDIFFRHYRGLVSPGEGEKYFNILSRFARFLQDKS